MLLKETDKRRMSSHTSDGVSDGPDFLAGVSDGPGFLAGVREILQCPVCISVYYEHVQLTCCHIICRECANLLLANNRAIKCPLCRQMTSAILVRKNPTIDKITDLLKGALTGAKSCDDRATVQEPGDRCVSERDKFWRLKLHTLRTSLLAVFRQPLHDLVVLDGRVWCLHATSIDILSGATGESERRTEAHGARRATVQGECVIAVGRKGVQQFSADGQLVDTLDHSDKYHDIAACHDSTLVAVMITAFGHTYMSRFVYSRARYGKQSETRVQMPARRSEEELRMRTAGKRLFLSSRCDGRVFEVDEEGAIVQDVQPRNYRFDRPQLVAADERSVVVADSDQLVVVDLEQMTAAPLKGVPVGPLAVDQVNRLVVAAQYSGTKLYRVHRKD